MKQNMIDEINDYKNIVSELNFGYMSMQGEIERYYEETFKLKEEMFVNIYYDINNNDDVSLTLEVINPQLNDKQIKTIEQDLKAKYNKDEKLFYL